MAVEITAAPAVRAHGNAPEARVRESPVSWLRPSRGELALLVVAAALYASAITWGVPRAIGAAHVRTWATDSQTPLGPLTEASGAIQRRQGNSYLGYPLMHHFLLAAVYVPYLGGLWATGGFANPAATYPFGFRDPVTALATLEIIARSVSLLMALVIVGAVSRIGTLLWDRRTGLLAAAFAAGMMPLVYYARTGNLDVPVLFWTMVAMVAYVRMLVAGITQGRLVWFGVAAAAAVATKEQALGAVVFAAIGIAVAARRGGMPASRLARLALLALVPSALVYAVGSGLAVDPARYIAHLQWMRGPQAFSLQRLPATFTGYSLAAVQLGSDLVDAIGPVLVVVALLGAAAIARRESHRALLLLPLLGHVLFLLLVVRFSQLRYVMLLGICACLAAARVLAPALRSTPAKRRLAGAVSVLAVGWLLAMAGDLTWQMRRDSRYEAAEFLNARLRPGDRVGHVVSISNLPHLREGVEYVFVDRPEIVSLLAASQPEYVILMPDWMSAEGSPFPGDFSPAVFDSLTRGALGYDLAARFKTRFLMSRQVLDYPSVNPVVHVFRRRAQERQSASR